MRRLLALGVIGVAVLLMIVALAGEDEPGVGGSAGTAVAGDGTFKVVFAEAEAGDRDTAAFLRERGTIQDIADVMGDTFALPRDITIRVQSGDEGPYYDPEKRVIVMNHPFVEEVAATFEQAEPDIDAEELQASVDDVVAFVLLHEIGHALVDQLQIPVTAREEDSVDNLATVITADFVEDGSDIARAFSDFFALIADDPSELDEEAFWGEHSLDLQRANQALCLLYGSDEDGNEDLLEFIPDERAEQCPAEWEQISDSWGELLDPYVKD